MSSCDFLDVTLHLKVLLLVLPDGSYNRFPEAFVQLYGSTMQQRRIDRSHAVVLNDVEDVFPQGIGLEALAVVGSVDERIVH